MEIEDVARISLTAWGPAKKQRQGAVSNRVFGKIIKDDQDILPLLHPFLGHRHPSEGRDVLLRSRLRSRSVHYGDIIKTMFGFEFGNERSDRRILLADRHVNAVDAFALLIDDRINRDRGFAGLAVTDDELPLTPTD